MVHFPAENTQPGADGAVLDLIGRLEAASAGSRELDAHVTVALRLDCKRNLPDDLQYLKRVRKDDECAEGTYWYVCRSGMSLRSAEPVTTCVTAALALAERVLPGCGWNVRRNDWGVTAEVYPYEPDTRTEAQKLGFSFTTYEPKTPPFGSAPTPALALCLAILKATTAPQPGLGGDEAEGGVNQEILRPSPDHNTTGGEP